ncbi:sensor histidine kinase [Sediminibacterium goheungense]|uniref:Histidine kinase n=1 Tax=Sediminibacterium goheungense TaxID=1086393 RepID=A0A4R6IWI1_9BACT|nr:histidine kinase [Sediminibacterium goheungense]TDO27069.1 histidine kinase [Sediminibacterium goheungense]
MVTPITKGRNFYVAFFTWWLVWTIIHVWVLREYQISFIQSVTDAFTSNFLLASFCLLVVNNMKYYLPRKERYWYILIISLVLSSLYLFLARTILKFWFKEDDVYLSLLRQSFYIRYITGFLMIGCMSMISLLWYTLLEQQENEQRKEEAEKISKDAELLKLRQQLQPHFLFNSLNSISALAGSQPEKARHMIQQLSDFLRGTLKKEEHQQVSLQEEIHHLQLYLDIEKVRFGHRLQTSLLIDEQASKMQIPVLLLQPVVENAIKFGLYDTTDEVLISILAKGERPDMLEIVIQNPFDPSTTITTQGTGFGLASISRRLYLLYARQDLIRTSKTDSLFTTHILIPQYNPEIMHHKM